MKSQHEAASTFKDAASCFKKSNPEGTIYFIVYYFLLLVALLLCTYAINNVMTLEAYIYFNEAITLYCEIGRFTTAGKVCVII